jgi:hypothetical protein
LECQFLLDLLQPFERLMRLNKPAVLLENKRTQRTTRKKLNEQRGLLLLLEWPLWVVVVLECMVLEPYRQLLQFYTQVNLLHLLLSLLQLL